MIKRVHINITYKGMLKRHDIARVSTAATYLRKVHDPEVYIVTLWHPKPWRQMNGAEFLAWVDAGEPAPATPPPCARDVPQLRHEPCVSDERVPVVIPPTK